VIRQSLGVTPKHVEEANQLNALAMPFLSLLLENQTLLEIPKA
jgi:hypothetical protein